MKRICRAMVVALALTPALALRAGTPAHAFGVPCAAVAGPSGAELMKRAEALEAAGKYHEAGDVYTKAADAFETAGNVAEEARALKKSAAMLEKSAGELANGAPRATAAANNRPAPPQPAANPPPIRPVSLPSLQPRAGYIIGRVVAEGGGAVTRCTMDYSGFEDGVLASPGFNGALQETVRGSVQVAGGRYQIKVPPGAYRISGYATFEWHGRTYNFPLEPINEPARHDFAGLALDKLRGGLVRDFVLKLTGRRAGSSDQTETVYKHAFYGGRVAFDCWQANAVLGGGIGADPTLDRLFPPDSRVQVTFTPQGPMVDGSVGRPVFADLRLGDHLKYTFNVRGMVPGQYTAVARLVTPAGATAPLRISLTRGKTIIHGAGQYNRVVVDWQPSVTFDFMPNDIGLRPVTEVADVTLYLGK